MYGCKRTETAESGMLSTDREDQAAPTLKFSSWRDRVIAIPDGGEAHGLLTGYGFESRSFHQMFTDTGSS